jgi:hypothetical protein
MEEDLTELGTASDNVEAEMRRTPIRQEYLLSDLVALGFARDVLENIRAVAILTQSEVPRSIYPCCRAAFEAAQDLLLLAARPNYAEWGARAFINEIYEREEVRSTARAIFEDLGEPELVPVVDEPEVQVRISGEEWERQGSGKIALVERAHSAVIASRKARAFHWSGLTRTKIHQELVRYIGNDPISGRIYKSYYSLLSIQSHPAPRLEPKHVVRTDDDKWAYIINPPDSGEFVGMGLRAAILAAKTTLVALTIIREPDPNSKSPEA